MSATMPTGGPCASCFCIPCRCWERTACAPPVFGGFTTVLGGLPRPQGLSDDDVERIAKRVVELLKEQREP